MRRVYIILAKQVIEVSQGHCHHWCTLDWCVTNLDIAVKLLDIDLAGTQFTHLATILLPLTDSSLKKMPSRIVWILFSDTEVQWASLHLVYWQSGSGISK